MWSVASKCRWDGKWWKCTLTGVFKSLFSRVLQCSLICVLRSLCATKPLNGQISLLRSQITHCKMLSLSSLEFPQKSINWANNDNVYQAARTKHQQQRWRSHSDLGGSSKYSNESFGGQSREGFHVNSSWVRACQVLETNSLYWLGLIGDTWRF